MGLVCAFAKLADSVDKLRRWLEENKKKSIKYSDIHLINKRYKLDTVIDLLIRPRESRHVALSRIGIEETTYYNIEIEVPVTLNSLEGEFSVKEVKNVSLFLLDSGPLAGYAFLMAEKKDVFGPTAYALAHTARVTLHSVSVSFTNPDVVRRLSELGNVKWLVVRDIRDPRLSAASFHGDHLENHEIVRILTRRGRVSGAIIIDKKRRIRITLGRSGRIYTPQSVGYVALAEAAAEILQRLLDLGAVSVEEPLYVGFMRRRG